ncbi:MAG: Fe2+-dependent dioxygenase [Prochlorotrichaceae cyanobacterium]|jgi:PKHD-type hydroxylase
MIVHIDRVLSPEALHRILDLLRHAKFIDGRLTAGTFAKIVKHNDQLDRETDLAKTIETTIHQAIQQNTLFQSVARPKVIRPCLINRYSPGMAYGWHTDNAIMGQNSHLNRSDLSFTLFLSDPETYEGGELVLDTDNGERSIKLAAGAMVLYPSTYLHRVAEVTAGERLAAVSWVQSLVRDTQQRDLLFELDTVRRSLFEKYGKTEEFDLLSKTHANLLRQWADA